jgi:lipid-binding SYLF domain-containing protein
MGKGHDVLKRIAILAAATAVGLGALVAAAATASAQAAADAKAGGHASVFNLYSNEDFYSGANIDSL